MIYRLNAANIIDSQLKGETLSVIASRESSDETGVLDEDDPHFVLGPGEASFNWTLSIVRVPHAQVDGWDALWSDISSWDVLNIAMVVLLSFFLCPSSPFLSILQREGLWIRNVRWSGSGGGVSSRPPPLSLCAPLSCYYGVLSCFPHTYSPDELQALTREESPTKQ